MARAAATKEPEFKADPDSAEPLYLQLAGHIERSIRSGRIPLDTRLPSERLYAQQLGLSRTTVTAAYQELMALGLVRGHVGRGTLVIADEAGAAAGGAVAWPQLASRLARAAPAASQEPAPGVVSLGNGWLHPSLVPAAALAACAAKVLQSTECVTRAAPLHGLPALRAALAGCLRADGVKAAAEELLITGGAQQGLNVVARSLVSPGDAVVCESPTWHGAFAAFRAAGAEVAGVAMDREGPLPAALEDALIRLRPKFVYLIPSFQCPSGRLMSLPRRRAILDLCARFRTPILESHVYAEAHFGAPMPSLKSLDSAGIVILQGSASKLLGPALRLGWLLPPAPALPLLAATKAGLDLSTPLLNQAILARFLAEGGQTRHLPAFRRALQARRDALLAALARHCPELRCLAPQGGIYVWAQLPRPLAAQELEAAALRHGVAVKAGDAFLPEGGASGHIRLCYAAPEAGEIETGAQRLGRALRELLQQQRAAPVAADLAPV